MGDKIEEDTAVDQEEEYETESPNWNDQTAELLERVVDWFFANEYDGDPVVKKLIDELWATIDGLS